MRNPHTRGGRVSAVFGAVVVATSGAAGARSRRQCAAGLVPWGTGMTRPSDRAENVTVLEPIVVLGTNWDRGGHLRIGYKEPTMRFLALACLLLGVPGLAVAQPVHVQTPFDTAVHDPYMSPGTVTVTGEAAVRDQIGRVIHCAGKHVFAFPATPYFAEVFSLTLAGRAPRHTLPDPRYQRLMRVALCDAQGRFSFNALTPGEWRIGTVITWTLDGTKQGGGLSRLVSLNDGQRHELRLGEEHRTAEFTLAQFPPYKLKVLQAKDILDNHFGDRADLTRAAALLNEAMAQGNKDADLFVQAARLTITGEHLLQSLAGVDANEAYSELLERALALDSKNRKAHILRAGAFSARRDLPREKQSLDQAAALGEDDPWLWLGYARYYRSLRDATQTHWACERAGALGPGESVEHRNAYVWALICLAEFDPLPGKPSRLKEFAEAARKAWHPRDADAPLAFAGYFLDGGFYEEAVVAARESLAMAERSRTRLTLAAALFGQAALLEESGQREASTRAIEEASAMGFAKDLVMRQLTGPSKNFSRLLPRLDRIIR